MAKKPRLEFNNNKSQTNSVFQPENFYQASVKNERVNEKFKIRFIDYFVKFFNVPLKNEVELSSVLSLCFEDLISKIRQRSGVGEKFASFEFVDENLPGGAVNLPFVRLDKVGANHLTSTIAKVIQ